MPILIYSFLFLELLVISFFDLKVKKISNLYPITNIIIFIVLINVYPSLYSLGLSHLYLSLIFLLVGLFLFLLKIMGAGDSKLLFSLFLLIPYNLQDIFLLYLLVITIIVGGSLFIFNTVKNINSLKIAYIHKDVNLIKGVYGKKFPFAPLIFLSWIALGVDLWIK